MQLITLIELFQRYTIKCIIHHQGRVLWSGLIAEIPARYLLKKIRSLDIWPNNYLEINI